MQRFQRDSEGALSADTFSQLYAHKVRVIKTYFPPSLAATYAQPILAGDGVLEWWTTSQGLVRPYAELSHAEQKRLLEAWHAQQATLARLQEDLSAKGLQTEAAHIGDLIAQPQTTHLFSVEGQLLITRWQAKPAQPVPPPAVAAPTPTPVPVVPPVRPRCRWCWLLLALLLLLLGLLWLWWRQQQAAPQVPPEPICEAVPGQATTPAVSSKPPEFVVVLDTSGSMQLNIKTPPGMDQALMRARDYGLDKVDPSLRQWFQGPLRSDIARQSITDLVDKLPNHIDVQFITFSGHRNGCSQPLYWGDFDLSQRPALRQHIGQMQFDGATEFAASMRLAAQSVDGVNNDAVVVLLVDGEDGCNENICETAASIAQAKPRLVFNVVDISGAGLANCVAERTGGQVFSSQDANVIQNQLSQASEKAIQNNADQQCRN